MKYLKTNEGLFSKDEIPKKLIDDIKSDIETKYTVTVSRVESDEDRGIYERIKFITKTNIGNVDTVLTLKSPNGVPTGSISARLSSKLLRFEVYHGKMRYVDSDSKLSNWKNIDVTSVLNNIDYVVNRVITENKHKKELADFYGKITEEEIKDLSADLYDLIGDYTISKASIKGKKGFKLNFSNNFDFIHIDNNYENGKPQFRPTDQLVELIKELNSLAKRVNDGYNMNLIYSFRGRAIDVSIYEKSKK